MTYRQEIDGLRALAVIPVIIFHANFPVLSGGFIGVDVFFVISGFLITSIIASELQSNTFSLRYFYIRRARRILPALLFITLLCIPVAFLILLPEDLKDFAKSLVAVITFSSNFLFWQESNYFGGAAELKPLLHTWSLAVEEQFYILFPVFLMCLYRFFRNHIFFVVLLFFILSLVLSQFAVIYRPDAAFYLLPFRGWELLAGTLLALNQLDNRLCQVLPVRDNIFSLAGLLSIVIPLFLYSRDTSFPGVSALLPVMGTVLIIRFARKGTYVNSLLSWRPLVLLGLISYSAYLWHQPLLAFTRYFAPGEPSIERRALICLAVLPLSILSWKFIEKPFRQNVKIPTPKFFFSSLGLSGLILFAGLIVSFNIFSITKYGRADLYENTKLEPLSARTEFYTASDYPPVVLWGDSYADVLARDLGSQLAKINIPMLGYIMQSCPAVIGVLRNEDQRLGVNFKENCKKFNEQALADILSMEPAPRFVVITSSYTWYMTERNRANEPILLDENDRTLTPIQHLPENLAMTIARLVKSGIKPVVILPHPRLKELPAILRSGRYDPNVIPVNTSTAMLHASLLKANLSSFGEQILLIPSTEILCSDEKEFCNVLLKGNNKPFLWSDGGHLSRFGAAVIAERIIELTMAGQL